MTREGGRRVARLVLAVAFFAVGVIHLGRPQAFLPIVPGWVPFPRQTVLATGACEVAGAIALIVPRLRWLAGVMLALYAVCVFPANIKHAVDELAGGVAVGGVRLGWGYHLPRLLFQPVIVWWALFAGGVIDWPWREGK